VRLSKPLNLKTGRPVTLSAYLPRERFSPLTQPGHFAVRWSAIGELNASKIESSNKRTDRQHY